MPQLNKRMVRTFDDLDVSWLRTQIMTSELLGDSPITQEIDEYIDDLEAQEIQKRKKVVRSGNDDFR